MIFAPTVRSRSFSPRAFDRSFERFFNDAFAYAPTRSLKVEDLHRLPGSTPHIETDLARDEVITAVSHSWIDNGAQND